MKTKIYNLKGEVVGEQELNPGVFGVKVKPVVVQQVVVAQQANSRAPFAHAKGRAEVRGGGRKPWKQKGTGRARHGSIRSPLWKGGGVTFGPTKIRNFKKGINKKMKQSALRMVLSDKQANERLVVVETLALPEIKTKSIVQALSKLPIKGHKTLLILDKEAKNVPRSARNLPDVSMLGAQSLNVVDLLGSQTVIVPISALQTIDKLYAPKV